MSSDFGLPCVDFESIEKRKGGLKANKAAGHDGKFLDHIINSRPALSMHPKQLFTNILSHSFVPDAFGFGVIIPIVKDECG